MMSTPLVVGEDTPPTRFDGTSLPRLPRNSYSPVKSLFDNSPVFHLRLDKVIGTTTFSTCGFDFNISKSTFVTCAGSIAVLSQVESDLSITQRFFRAHPSVSPSLTPCNEPGTPTRSELRKSRISPIRISTVGIPNVPASPAQSLPGTPGRGGARQGSRAANCVSLSSDGKLLAVGEVGYNPQIYIFSCASDNSCPIAALSEHSYGVKCLALSADGRWLASVGDIHDGYIFLWSLVGRGGFAAKLQASNKCTSTVNAMTWMGNVIVTVGLRHVKVWRPQAAVPPSPAKPKFKAELKESVSASPGSKTLHGRNCILGDLLESDFTCVAALSSTRAVIGTDRGELCMLDDDAGNQKLVPILRVGYPIHCVSIDHSNRRLWIGGSQSRTRCLQLEELDRLLAAPALSLGLVSGPTREGLNETSNILGLAPLSSCLVGLDSNRTLKIMTSDGFPDSEAKLFQAYTSHQGAVLSPTAVSDLPIIREGFITYDSTGALKVWDNSGGLRLDYSVPLEQLPFDESVERNELKIAKVSSTGNMLIAGDKYGIIRLIRLEPWEAVFSIRAHAGEVNDIAFSKQPGVPELAATSGRDRSIQLFEVLDYELRLLQTIDQHTSAVTCVAFAQDGKMLLSASADRTIAVFGLASNDGSRAFLPLRIMPLKQSPVSMVLDTRDTCRIHISTIDKQLHTYDINTGQCISSNRTADERQTNPILLSSLTLRSFDAGAAAKRLLIGASSTDKSVRVHDADSGIAVTFENGHSEGVGGVAIMKSLTDEEQKSCQVVSTGLDGTVMLWNLSFAPRITDSPNSSSPVHEMPALVSPLRRVLSNAAFADFSKSLEADGMAPIPQPVSSRGSSPARRRVSTTLVTPASPKPQTPRARRLERSSSSSTPNTPTQHRTKSKSRVTAVEASQNLNFAMETLSQALRDFQDQLAYSPQELPSNKARSLERQLRTTLEIIGKGTPLQTAESHTDKLLERYAERLAQLVEAKVALGAASRTSTVESSLVSSSAEASAYVSESEESEPPYKLERVYEE